MTDNRQNIKQTVVPMVEQARGTVYQNAKLFARVKTVAESGPLTTENQRLADDYMRVFAQNGVHLSEEQQQQLTAHNTAISTNRSTFAQKAIEQDEAAALLVETAEELAGLDEAKLARLAKAATEAGHDGKYLIKLNRTTKQPLLKELRNPEIRRRLYEASANRGRMTLHLAAEILQRRQKKAQLLGHNNFATHRLSALTVGTPDRVFELIGKMVPPLREKTNTLARQMKALKQAEGDNTPLQPWDWQFYAAKLQQQQSGVDQKTLKPYFEFENVLKNGVFLTAEKLYGIKVVPRPDLPVYHPDVRAYDILDKDGKRLAVFYGDYFAREGKRSGAWKSIFSQQFHAVHQGPVVVNVANISKTEGDKPTLLTLAQVKTLFHEFGHTLHEIFSSTRYASNAGTRIPRDCVEFPAKLHERWAFDPQVMATYAVHHKTGEVLSPHLIQQLVAQQSSSQNPTLAIDTFERLATAVLDLELHLAPKVTVPWDEFERQALQKHGLDSSWMRPRYRAGYFGHIFRGAYASIFFSYFWGDILAADAWAFMQENGGLTRENGQHLRDEILSRGNSVDFLGALKAWRGQDPTPKAFLKEQGIA